eukprot:scaffold7028_cov243-Pinguiococcus_pyrenoidosus.AAC.23
MGLNRRKETQLILHEEQPMAASSHQPRDSPQATYLSHTPSREGDPAQTPWQAGVPTREIAERALPADQQSSERLRRAEGAEAGQGAVHGRGWRWRQAAPSSRIRKNLPKPRSTRPVVEKMAGMNSTPAAEQWRQPRSSGASRWCSCL